ncbi:MAG: CaiB/BaiF CoA-transferase family protein [Thermoanaerobaculales bacterium]|jgi:crotonobetainyl-CoA:carnitine CoA-transferase CaiB-like acyl-CoA transferase|nr:CaiB/BaiF CoA-transferase family protein [Thermoanaerobaculales bacterium]
MTEKPLSGVKVLELGQLMAGPFAGTLLAYFGADVIKVEPPGRGDAVRGWRAMTGDTSLWWYSLGRNKRSVTVNLKSDEGRRIIRRLAGEVDVLIENFRPGTLENWGLGPDDLQAINPGLIIARVSGYGQDGPYSSRPGYASVCEGVGGLRYVNGFPGQPPVRQNLSLGDSLTGLHTAFGILLSLFHRNQQTVKTGQVVDVGIYEAVYNMMEAVVPEYDRMGMIREPSGTTITGVVPTNTYPCRDDKYVIIGGNGDSIFKRLMTAAGRPDMADDPELVDNAGRLNHQERVDGAISDWTRTLTAAEVLEVLEMARVPAGLIYSVVDMVNDPHFQARGLFEVVEAGGEPLTLPAIIPKLSKTPGKTEWAGPTVGEHTRQVLGEVLGLSDDELDTLSEEGVI